MRLACTQPSPPFPSHASFPSGRFCLLLPLFVPPLVSRAPPLALVLEDRYRTVQDTSPPASGDSGSLLYRSPTSRVLRLRTAKVYYSLIFCLFRSFLSLVVVFFILSLLLHLLPSQSFHHSSKAFFLSDSLLPRLFRLRSTTGIVGRRAVPYNRSTIRDLTVPTAASLPRKLELLTHLRVWLSRERRVLCSVITSTILCWSRTLLDRRQTRLAFPASLISILLLPARACWADPTPRHIWST